MKKTVSSEFLYRLFLYFTLTVLAVCVLIPVLWVIMASVKSNSEFYESPWKLPSDINIKNFTDAWNRANMGSYFLNSLTVTGLSLLFLLITAIPCAYALSRFSFFGRRLIRTVFMAGLFINVSYLVVPIFLMLVDVNAFFGAPDRKSVV